MVSLCICVIFNNCINYIAVSTIIAPGACYHCPECPPYEAPVCLSNGLTFLEGRCHLECAKRQDRSLSSHYVAHDGPCGVLSLANTEMPRERYNLRPNGDRKLGCCMN